MLQTPNILKQIFQYFKFNDLNQTSALIQQKREKLKLNKSQMAERLGISSQLLGQYEQGKRTPKTSFFLKWKEVFKEDLLKDVEANVSRETQKDYDQGDPTPMNAIHSLAESTNKLSDSNLINARNIERLIALLEMRLVTAANINPELAPRGTPGTIPITKEGQQKNQHKAG